MLKNSEEPREFDAVKGGQLPPPLNGAVLGGIEGLRQYLASLDEQVRLDAVANASEYDDEGIDILVKALKDTSLQVRVNAYKVLKELNKAESEIAKGIRLNVGDNIYCVYRSSLSYGDDFYYLEDSTHQDYITYQDEEECFYKPQLDDGDGYAHYITALKEKKKSYWDYGGLPEWTSLHIFKGRAKEAAKNLHIQRLLEIDDEYGMIYNQPFYNKDQLSQWCNNNGLCIVNLDEDEYDNEFQIRIFKFLQQSGDINLLEKFWKFTVKGRLAFVYKRKINRKCYFRVMDNI
ncbi:hypothetical protein RIVM261_089160 [Rivularia sp. IAM M-261]|nr:hypothetical protein RIVM261_089160 [Rivularia sp. IAM M-261]